MIVAKGFQVLRRLILSSSLAHLENSSSPFLLLDSMNILHKLEENVGFNGWRKTT